MEATSDYTQRAFNPNDLILDSMAKEQSIDSLENHLYEKEFKMRRKVKGLEDQLIGQGLQWEALLKDKDARIKELEGKLDVMNG